MKRRPEKKWNRRVMLLAGFVLASSVLVQPGPAWSAKENGSVAARSGPAVSSVKKRSPYHPEGVTKSAKSYYQAVWGIDNLLVRHTASGNLIRFSYRVVDPARAKALSDKKVTPYMIGQRSRAVLQVPVMNKVGALRQAPSTTGSGQDLWMVFSNKGNPVKPGDRVDVIIGSFRAVGLMVE